MSDSGQVTLPLAGSFAYFKHEKIGRESVIFQASSNSDVLRLHEIKLSSARFKNTAVYTINLADSKYAFLFTAVFPEISI